MWGSLDRSDHMAARRRRGSRSTRIRAAAELAARQSRQSRRRASRRRSAASARCADGRAIEGLRATPIASIGGGDDAASRVAMPPFLGDVSESDRSRRRALRGRHVPARSSATSTSCRAASAARSTFAVCFGRDTVSAEPLAGCDRRCGVGADPVSYRQAGAWAPLAPRLAVGSANGYDALVGAAVEGRRLVSRSGANHRRVRLAQLR